MAYFLGGKRLEPGKSFSAGDTLFPENYLNLSTSEEKKALGITEQKDPEPIRIAGVGPTSEVNLDTSSKSSLDSSEKDLPEEDLEPRYAGDIFNIKYDGVTYKKPEHQHGGVIRGLGERVSPPTSNFLPSAKDTPATSTPPKVDTPITPTPPKDTSPSIDAPKQTTPTPPPPTFNEDSQSEEAKPNQAFVHAPSIIEQARTKNPISTIYGINKSYFGGEDLEAAREAGHSDADILKYLDANPSLLREQNVKGGGGLYDQLNPAFHQHINKPAPMPDYTSNLSDQQPFRNAPEPSSNQGERKPISIEYGISSKYFGGEDLEAAKEAGYSDREILDYLNAATNLLREQNVPGGGGLYDQLKARVG